MTSMFGKLNAGPASSSAKAGPLPMPAPIRPWRIGTSVSVAKYIKAPKMLAKKFVHTGQTDRARFSNAPPPQPAISSMRFGLSPTSISTYLLGMTPSWSGRPSRKPATSTPINSNGRICLAKPHVAANHSPPSPLLVLRMIDKPTMAAEKGMSTHKPPAGRASASTAGGMAASTTFHHLTANQKIRMSENATAKAAVTSHLFRQTVVHVPGSGFFSAIPGAFRSNSSPSSGPSSIFTRYTAPAAAGSSGALVIAARSSVPSLSVKRQSLTAPQLANTSTPTITKKNRALCARGRDTSDLGAPSCPLALAICSLR